MIEIRCSKEQELLDIMNSLMDSCPFTHDNSVDCGLIGTRERDDKICGECVRKHVWFSLLDNGDYKNVNNRLVYSDASLFYKLKGE